MSAFDYDLIFAGCGLAAGLSAYRLHTQRPDLRLLVLDAGRPGDYDQTWSFQTVPDDQDKGLPKAITAPDQSWLAPFLAGYWPRYDVHFPELQRTLPMSYASIRYPGFIKQIRETLGPAYRSSVWIERVQAQSVTLRDGTTLRARVVLDARGWGGKPDASQCGFQKFAGLQLKLKKPHGLEHPILMDATVPQVDGFRFMYVLPWDSHRLLIEDTHYSRTAEMDTEHYHDEIRRYAAQKSWRIEEVLGSEQGALPIPYYGQEKAPVHQAPTIGVRAGLFHPTTGYSIYEAILTAEWLASQTEWSAPDLLRKLNAWSLQRWKQHEFYRRLNNMLFFASADEQRYRVLEKFYEHEDDLVARFYSGQTSARDKLTILSGRPPVPVSKGIYHFFHRVGVTCGTA